MRKIVEEQLSGLDTAQRKRLDNYANNLATDRDDHYFDDHLLSVIKPFMKMKEFEEVLSYLRGIGYTSSKYEYSKIEEQLERFLEPNHPDFRWSKNYQRAKLLMMKEFADWRLRPVTYHDSHDIVEILPKKDTHAGFEYILTGMKSKGDYLTADIVEKYRDWEQHAREQGTFNNIVLIGTRTQASGAFDSDNDYAYTNKFKSKSRLVSMVRLPLILAECRFARPLQFKLGQANWYAGGKDDLKIHAEITTMQAKFRYSYTLDYSHYDQSISDWLIRDAFDIMWEAFTGTTESDKELFFILREDMIRKYFIDGHGNVHESRKGVGSGSMFTQLVDSIVNKLIITTYMLCTNNAFDCIIMGDDNLIYTREEVDIENLCSFLKYKFGIEANPDKCSSCLSTDAPEFLSREWTSLGVYRNPKILISKILYPERFRDYHKGADAHMIIYAYILSFPLGMQELMDTYAFTQQYAPRRDILRDKEKSRYLSGLMKYRLEYL